MTWTIIGNHKTGRHRKTRYTHSLKKLDQSPDGARSSADSQACLIHTDLLTGDFWPRKTRAERVFGGTSTHVVNHGISLLQLLDGSWWFESVSSAAVIYLEGSAGRWNNREPCIDGGSHRLSECFNLDTKCFRNCELAIICQLSFGWIRLGLRVCVCRPTVALLVIRAMFSDNCSVLNYI